MYEVMAYCDCNDSNTPVKEYNRHLFLVLSITFQKVHFQNVNWECNRKCKKQKWECRKQHHIAKAAWNVGKDQVFGLGFAE